MENQETHAPAKKETRWFYATSVEVGNGKIMDVTLGGPYEVTDEKEKVNSGYILSHEMHLPLRIAIDGHKFDCRAVVGVTNGELKFLGIFRPDYDAKKFLSQGTKQNPANYGSFFLDAPPDIFKAIGEAFHREEIHKNFSQAAVDEAKHFFTQQHPSWRIK